MLTITYLLINDATNEVIHTAERFLPDFRHYGKYENGKLISLYTGAVLSTVEEDLSVLVNNCLLTEVKA